MALSRNRKRWVIILGSILLILIILILFANSFLSRKADQRIRAEISKVDTTEYIIDFDRIRVNIFNMSVKIHDISVKPSPTALENVKRSQLSKPVFEIHLDRVKLSSVSIMKAIKGEGVDIGSISLRDPDITIYGHGHLFKSNGKDNDGQGMFSSDSLSETMIKEARLGSFKIEDAQLRYIDLSNDKSLLETRDLNISVSDLWLHHPEGDTLSYVLEVDDINIELASHSMELPGNFYSLAAGPLKINYKDQEVSIDSLKLIPAYPKGKFGKAFGKQTDRFEVSADNIFIDGLVFDSLINKKLIAENLRLTSAHADICRDKRVERDMSIFPKLFQTSVALLPIKLDIGSISTSKAYVNYQEIVEGATEPGPIILDQLDMKITGVCNYEDSIKNGQVMHVDAAAMLMGKSPIQVYFDLPIGNHAEYFTYYGTASSFPAKNLNPMLERLLYVEATNGTINSVAFYAMAMNDTTAGRLEFKYSDLEVNVLKKAKENENVQEKNKFFSFVAKAAIHKNNPNPDKDVRIAKMSFIRDPNKGFFNYIWKTIQDGIIVTMTPGKKRLATDMGWTKFQGNWKKTLLDDWNTLQLSKEEKKEEKKGKKKKSK